MFLNTITTHTTQTARVIDGDLVDLIAVARRLDGDTTVALTDGETEAAICLALARSRTAAVVTETLDLTESAVDSHRKACRRCSRTSEDTGRRHG